MVQNIHRVAPYIQTKNDNNRMNTFRHLWIQALKREASDRSRSPRHTPSGLEASDNRSPEMSQRSSPDVCMNQEVEIASFLSFNDHQSVCMPRN